MGVSDLVSLYIGLEECFVVDLKCCLVCFLGCFVCG